MDIGVLRGTTVLLACAAVSAVSPLAAEPVALRGYNAPIGESSISGISSGAFMAVQFAPAWSSVMKGVGGIAGGAFLAGEGAARDNINPLMPPVPHADGSTMGGPPPDIS